MNLAPNHNINRSILLADLLGSGIDRSERTWEDCLSVGERKSRKIMKQKN